MDKSEDNEVARVELGVPGASASIPVRKDWLRALTSRFRLLPLRDAVVPAGARIDLSIQDPDTCYAWVYLSVATFDNRVVDLEEVRVRAFLVGSSLLPGVVASPISAVRLKPLALTGVTVQLQLHTSEIRRLLPLIRPGQSPLSSPEASIGLEGTLVCLRKGKREVSDFRLESIGVRLNVPKHVLDAVTGLA
jgi:hypothetical protein